MSLIRYIVIVIRGRAIDRESLKKNNTSRGYLNYKINIHTREFYGVFMRAAKCDGGAICRSWKVNCPRKAYTV